MRRLFPDHGDLDDASLRAAYADAPRLRVNFVSSLDGAVTLDGHAAGLSSPGDQRILALLRSLCDVLLVGAGTVRAEGYSALLRDRSAQPRLAIVSHNLGLPPDHPSLSATDQPALIITHESAPVAARKLLEPHAEIVVCGATEVDLPAALEALAARGLRRVLSEGGPTVFGALLAAGLVDELCLTVSPLLAGPGAQRIVDGRPSPVQEMVLKHVLADDGHLFLRYGRERRHNPAMTGPR
jgi:riboflavin biosynthesis pyrimidine reductase